MKNKKSLKTILNIVAFTTIAVGLVLLLIHIIGSNWDMESPLESAWCYFYSVSGTSAENAVIVMDWNYAALYLTLILIALVVWGFEFVYFTIPAFRRKNGELLGAKLFCKIVIGVGLIVAIISLLLPINHSVMDIFPGSICSGWHAASVMCWLGMPVAFAGCLANTGIALAKSSN